LQDVITMKVSVQLLILLKMGIMMPETC